MLIFILIVIVWFIILSLLVKSSQIQGKECKPHKWEETLVKTEEDRTKYIYKCKMCGFIAGS